MPVRQLTKIIDFGREQIWRISARGPWESLTGEKLSHPEYQGLKIIWPSAYSWSAAGRWVNPLYEGLRRLVPVEVRDVPQPDGQGVTQFILCHGVSERRIIIDWSDYVNVNDGIARASYRYFKMHFQTEGYKEVNVRPGGYPVFNLSLYKYLKHLRAVRDQREFQFDVHGRFGKDFAGERRERCLQRLSAARDFQFRGGFQKVRYTSFLREVARSRICVNLPGNGDLCFRLIDYLAIGSFIISHPLGTRLPLSLIDREHIVFTKPDMSDLEDLVRYYLQHDTEREKIATNARALFDKSLEVVALAKYYLNSCLDTEQI